MMASDSGNDSLAFDYNWDEFSIGNLHENHSNHFFVKKHPEHEKRENLLENAEQAEFNVDFDEENKKLNASADNHLKPSLQRENKNNKLSSSSNHLKLQPLSPTSSTCSSDASPDRRANVDKKSKVAAKECKEFNVVKFVKIYDIKKKAIMNAIEKREREQRHFHSKPAPNFHAIHAAVEKKRALEVPKITCPVTPTLVKRHREAKERLQKKKEDYEASLRPKPFISNPDPDVLRKKPFVPQLEKCHITPVPFNLQSDTRLKERRQYDENMKIELERKQQEREEQRQREEERMRREIRKATTFKAQPNPFK